MRLRLALLRDDGSSIDLAVSADPAATIGEVARAIAERDPRGSGGPWARPTLRRLGTGEEWAVLPPAATLGDDRLASGETIALEETPDEAAGGGAAVAVLEVRDGRQRGRSFPLRAGSWTLGRSPGADIRLQDPHVSARHARLEVGEAVEIVDLGSANGIVVDGERMSRVAVPVVQTLTLGATEVRVRMLPGRPDAPRGGGRVAFNRSPRVLPRYSGRTFTLLTTVQAGESPPFPWLAAVAPLLLGLAMAFLTGRPSALLFALFSPVVLVGGFLAQRSRALRRRSTAAADFEARCAAIEAEVVAEHAAESTAREAEAPSTATVVGAGIERSCLLWTRRPEHAGYLNVRLATGPARSRSKLDVPGRDGLEPRLRTRADALAERVTTVSAAPLVEDLREAGGLGCSGPPDSAASVLSAILAQLVGLHSPAELAVAAIVSPEWAGRIDWLKWVPHVGSPQSPLGARPHLADSTPGAAELLAAIEALILARAPTGRTSHRGRAEPDPDATVSGAERPPTPIPALVVVISTDAPADRARLVALSESGPDAGVFPVWAGEAATELPAACRTVVEAGPAGAGTVSFVRRGQRVEGARPETLDAASAARFGRSLAPVVDAGAASADRISLPRRVAMTELLGLELFDVPSAVEERWRENDSILDRRLAPTGAHRDSEPPAGPAPTRMPGSQRPSPLGAIIGSGDNGPIRLELRTHGPHALVGGTTGAGKSEFLQSWVLGLAAEHSPDRIAFLLVDYKGGSAFADCVRLPHCVGLVTDLRPHLVRRALTSLRAELRHRERLLARKGVKDLVDLERCGDPETPPALAIVIDEFAALASDVPEFVDGVIDLAQRGRSLGLHLVMATQRPSGVIKDSIRANTNIRIALRMADEAESLDVVGTRDAADLDPAVPGRALARRGPGRPHAFQAAFSGGRTTGGTAVREIALAELGFGRATLWPANAASVGREDVAGPSDQRRLVETISAAARLARIPPPRRPWLDILPPIIGLESLLTGDDGVVPFAMTDDPGEQRRFTATFRPDADGHIAFLGSGGSGKTVALRTLAAATAATPHGGPVHVYGLDYAAGGLRLLEALPHVGAVIPGEDGERVQRLLRRLRAELEDRSDRYAVAGASTIAEYRRRANAPAEPRLLLLIDGFPAFRDEWELAPGRVAAYSVLKAVLSSGRRLGVHVALTADRGGSIPGSINALIPRRVLLGPDDDRVGVGDPGRPFDEGSRPGRGVADGLEIQIAVLGAEGTMSTTADQSAALAGFVAANRAAIPIAEPIGSLPSEVPAAQMPSRIGTRAVLGVADETLALTGFDPVGAFLIAGPPGSGRSNALAWLVRSARALDPGRTFVYLGNDRSPLAADPGFARAATDPEGVAALARELVSANIAGAAPVLVIEGIAEFLHTPGEGPLGDLLRLARRLGLLVVAENEVSGWTGAWPLLTEVKRARRGLLLQPDPMDGEAILRTAVPPAPRSEFPPGRGLYVERGRAARVQVPHMLDVPPVIHSISPLRLPADRDSDTFARQAAIAGRHGAGES